jgi:hypothetical protein
VDRRFGWRQGKNQPIVSGIDRCESEDVSKEGPIRSRLFAVHDYMRTVDHDSCEG